MWIASSKHIFKKKPCLSCVVRSCCSRRCDKIFLWEKRFSMFSEPTAFVMAAMVVVMYLMLFITFGPLYLLINKILFVFSLRNSPEETSSNQEE